MMAPMVPMGIERWASAKSPDRFDPAMIPNYIPNRSTKAEIIKTFVVTRHHPTNDDTTFCNLAEIKEMLNVFFYLPVTLGK